MARTRIHGQQVTDGSIELVDLSSALQSSISGKADAGNLAPVATSGSYNDLSDLPTLFSGAYADLSGKPTLFSGDYADLSNKPSLFDGNYSSLSGAPVLSTVATSGSYNDLSNLPTLFSGSYNDLTDKPTFSSDLDGLTDVAITSPSADQVLKYNGTAWVNATAPATFSGSYNDLSDKPTIPSALDDLSDVAVSSAVKGQFIVHNGTSFVNSNTIEASGAAVKPLIVKGAASQTANLFEAQNSSGTVLLSINSLGYIQTPPVVNTYVTISSDPSANDTICRMYSPNNGYGNWSLFFQRAPTRKCFDIYSYSYPGGPSVSVNVPTTLGVGLSADIEAKFQVNTAAAGTKGMIVRGAASQTANLFEVQNSSSQINCAINDGGSITTAGEITVRGSGVSRFNSLLTTGGGVGGSLTNRGFTMLHQVSAETQMDFMTTADASATLSESMMCFNLVQNQIGFNTIRTSIDGQVHITTKAAARKALVVRGAASQTANLFEVQNSSGTGLFVIDSAGAINLPTTSPLVIKGNSGHTWNNTLMRVTDSTSAAYYFTVYGNGRMRMGTNDAPTSQGGDLLGTSNYTLAVNALSAGDGALCIQHPTNNVNPLILASTPSGVVLNVSQYGMYIKNLTAGYTPLRVDSVAGAANLMDVKSAGTSKFVVDSTGSITTGIVPVARVTGLHAVATSGSYNDLSDKPSIPSIAGLATETYVDTAVAAVVNSAPAVLDTLNELAAALNDDPNFATTMTTALAAKADSSSLADVATSGSYVDLSNKPTIYTPVKEVFTALVDGTETEFVLADAPAVAGTEQVFVNGILQSSGAGDDYTISGDTITFNTAPEAGWKLIVYYFV